jgi:hypothetical protein
MVLDKLSSFRLLNYQYAKVKMNTEMKFYQDPISVFDLFDCDTDLIRNQINKNSIVVISSLHSSYQLLLFSSNLSSLLRSTISRKHLLNCMAGNE